MSKSKVGKIKVTLPRELEISDSEIILVGGKLEKFDAALRRTLKEITGNTEICFETELEDQGTMAIGPEAVTKFFGCIGIPFDPKGHDIRIKFNTGGYDNRVYVDTKIKVTGWKIMRGRFITLSVEVSEIGDLPLLSLSYNGLMMIRYP